jgi:hypothetical protein
MTISMAGRTIDFLGRALDQRSIEALAQEMSWTPPMLLMWSQVRYLSVANQFKGLVEDFMEETWNWWPFERRLRRLGDGLCRLSWQTVGPFIVLKS